MFPFPVCHFFLVILLDWLKEKLLHEGFYALAAIYWPESKMPLESWKAAPSTSNGNEQAHRNIYRDGTTLTLLAGIIHGLQFDFRMLENIRIFTDEAIQPRDQNSTHFQRLLRGIKNKGFLFSSLQLHLSSFHSPFYSSYPTENCAGKRQGNHQTRRKSYTAENLHCLDDFSC